MNRSAEEPLQAGEHVVMVLHRHLFGFVKTLILFLIIGAVPVGLLFIWGQSILQNFNPALLSNVLVVVFGTLYYLFWWLLFYGFWLDFSLDYYIITNFRLIDVHQSGLFDRTIAEEYLTRVQDVTSVSRGFFPTILRYGDVFVQTAGETERFIFLQVHQPEEVTQKILKLAEDVHGGSDGIGSVGGKKK